MSQDNKDDQITMTFMDAISLVRAGKAVKRQSWAGYIMFVKTKVFVIHPGNPNFYALALESTDIMSDDWIEVFDASLPS